MNETTPEHSGLFRRILTRNVGLPLLMGLASILVFVALLLHLVRLLNWVDHTHRVISQGQDLALKASDQESSLRGFLLSGEDTFLAPYSIGRASFAADVQAAQQLVNDNAQQVDRLRRVGALALRWDDFARDAIALRRASQPVETLIRSQRGKQLFDEIRRELRAFIAAEERLLRERNEEAQSFTWMAVAIFVSLLIIVSGLIAWAGRRDITTLSREYGGAMDRMREAGAESEERAWLRGAQAELGERLLAERTPAAIAQQTLRFLAERADVVIGAAFTAGEEGDLHCVAAHGLSDDADSLPQAEHNLVAQAWRDGKPLRLSGLQAGFLKVATSLGDLRPADVMLVPALHEGRVNVVLELGFLKAPSARTARLLEQLQETLGSQIAGSLAAQRLQRSLEETRQLNEELQVQQEELRTANEELAEQSRVLSESQLHLEEQRAELEQTNVQLGEQSDTLARRNAALTQAQADLREKALDLQRASRYKSEFLANMSHELRTPLNSSLILSKLLLENKPGNLTDEQLKFAGTIHDAGKDLLTLINDILDLAKVEAGKLDVTLRPVELQALAEAMRRLFQPLAEDKGLAFAVKLAPGLPATLVTDGQRLEQVLRNLLSNAIKFTERGSVTLVVEPRGERIALIAHDTGIGIPPAQQQRVFEAFHQGDGALNRRYGGTGLGLSISRELSRLLGGDIELSSVEGEGSQFTLLLPLEAQMPQPADAAMPTLPPVARLAPVPVPERLSAAPAFDDDRAELTPDAPPRRLALVVEDDAKFAEILYHLAHEMQYRCLVTDNAQEALTLATAHLPQAILLDVRLPDGSGLTVLQRLKEDPRTRHIPVHIIAGEDFRDIALPMGAVGTAIKPTTREDLVEIFRKLERHGTDTVRRLLLVEDDQRQRESIAHLIADDDIEVVAVERGEEALRLLDEQHFDCMIIDLKLPDMDGNELLARMAARGPEQTSPPVIVYTGRNLSRDEEAQLNRYSRSIIIKGARSPERLLDEVTLFLHRVESRMSGERRDMLRTARNREQVFEGRKVLLVDDDMRNIFALTAVLEQRGLIVEPARNGAEALEKLDAANGDIDLVLMDVMMPVMDGLEATRRIRADARWQKLPVIAITAKAMRDDQEQCRRAGANDYLAKPIETDRLISLLRVWLPGIERV
ncbi:response regulator [Roseateles asaccharophilus]|uniref:histidine kinase n=1 Tax=Roseateles asaccharophilus TaxID=582607 RepID=A0ABU2A9G7_9BURK|nr:response regulator [Roseateles asaccharophilus]MDR7333804.1 CheY-like chemotaxis protein/signal transduction histidine kinase/CHASE3 domain sensor protein [Roseateles asaccharophilus]